MKKSGFLPICLILLTACSGNSEKKVPDKKLVAETSVTVEDEAMKKWLQGKEWKAESEGAPIEHMRIFSMDSCDYVYGKGPWNFKKAEFTFGKHDLVSWPFVKLSDTSFTLYVAPTKKTFVYHFIKNL